MLILTQAGRSVAQDMGRKYSFSEGAVTAVIFALAAGNGAQAQFNIAELGGMGQWSIGGMLMIGDMFNHALKARVAGLCDDLAHAMRKQLLATASRVHSSDDPSRRPEASSAPSWPQHLGRISSSGAQNDFSYAFFPDARRLAIRKAGKTLLYDTDDITIVGVSQQQGVDQSLAFLTPNGPLRLDELRLVSDNLASDNKNSAPSPNVQSAAPSSADLLQQIEKLGELRRKNVLTEEEFVAKKTELLNRL